MKKHIAIPRRTFLRGAGGAAIALPFLQAMLPSRMARAAVRAVAPPPSRVVICYAPLGIIKDTWDIPGGALRTVLPPTLQALQPFAGDLTQLQGIENRAAYEDFLGQHARSASGFLTCTRILPSQAEVRAGVSMDQILAQRLGRETRLPSLELGCDYQSIVPSTDARYSGLYTRSLSWKSPSIFNTKEIQPRAVFNRLFVGGGDPDQLRDDQSVLDYVLESIRALMQGLSGEDRQSMEEYLESIRTVERRIAEFPRSEKDVPAGVPLPNDIQDYYRTHYTEQLEIMFDLMAVALKSDITRVITFMLSDEQTNRDYSTAIPGVKGAHHSLSHHRGNKESIASLRKINQFHVSKFAKFVQRLKTTQEGDGSLLDYTSIVYGSGLGDADKHTFTDLPLILVGGRKSAGIQGGYVRTFKGQQLANLHLTLLRQNGVKIPLFGNSTGILDLQSKMA